MSNDISSGGAMARATLIAALLIPAGCSGSHPQPYSPNYSYLSMHGAPPAKGGLVRKGYDTTETQTLVPDACITPDTADQPLYLPSGCANNLNLQLMAADQRHLLKGREMGPAMAAPVARAAKTYIDRYGEGNHRNATNETEVE
ncbi:hypothetical protein possibly linked to type III secretion (plasmid) [Sinorhizobium fredii NGR234]|uniref:Uncharacterized protein n=1 Tax=Sinorhizobium fredii (strain NBRC 101917 / NGR234) TaxID=394 RepID=C3KN97_SINFN|nr:hypothetical protein [Sinorhizobium fredii]ACP23727.1 hypothetical protein possibly linked to type III secretion [Sinorhizobium fredii NGR234]